METLQPALGTIPWIAWACIGIVGGYMAGRLLKPDVSTALFVVVGVVGALLGGWGFTLISGTTERDIYISLLTSLVVCGIFIWIVNLIAPDDTAGDEDN